MRAERQRPKCQNPKQDGPCGGPLTTREDGDYWPKGANLRCAACGEWAVGTDDEVARAQRADRALDRRLAAEERSPLPDETRRARARGREAKRAQLMLTPED